jgi:hypothetical protein
MADRETSFLTRWSRRKRDPEKEPDPTVEPNTAERETADQSRTAVPAPQDDGESARTRAIPR